MKTGPRGIIWKHLCIKAVRALTLYCLLSFSFSFFLSICFLWANTEAVENTHAHVTISLSSLTLFSSIHHPVPFSVSVFLTRAWTEKSVHKNVCSGLSSSLLCYSSLLYCLPPFSLSLSATLHQETLMCRKMRIRLFSFHPSIYPSLLLLGFYFVFSATLTDLWKSMYIKTCFFPLQFGLAAPLSSVLLSLSLFLSLPITDSVHLSLVLSFQESVNCDAS